ncbi:cytochrome c [Microbulbifer marinus]|uniref:Cytochrome c, mono-and diheme variants n=1 Tax=Microbulbifer marinus TaxID=658218 RepID=A0A1H3VU37_9GAMM|nr:cytochrome c [Microbulbifer marinus]SDZ77744.1 Cytochrome c, mono-and diheme variants [Microbulbifer marinus]
MSKGWYLAIALLVILAVVLALAVWQPSIPAADLAKRHSFSPELVERGKVLAGIGNCETCHTITADKPYAGGVEFPSPFGSLYSTNISPHPEDGIGRWPREAFVRAMREGVSREGAHLYPAFPYTHYKNITDEDLDALYAYFMTREPVAHTPPSNNLSFPFNLRFLQWGWKLLFFDPDPWQPDPGRSEQWNRGAYLAKGLGHCSACHTPRNFMQAEKKNRAYAGALVDNWYATALDESQPVPVHWDTDSLYQYLRSGTSNYHGVAVGSMGEVVHRGLRQAPDSDIRALASYMESLSADRRNTGNPRQLAAETITAAQQRAHSEHGAGEALYVSACASCHYNDPQHPLAARAELSLNSAVTADDPTNLLRVVIEGVGTGAGTPILVMPGFSTLSDENLVELADFLRRRSNLPPWKNLQQRIGELRELHRQSQHSATGKAGE